MPSARSVWPLWSTSMIGLLLVTLACAHPVAATERRLQQEQVLSLLTPAGTGDGFLVIDASAASPNMSRLAFSLVPRGDAAFSSVVPSRSDPCVVEVVAALSKQRLVLLGLRGLAANTNDSDSAIGVVYARELVSPVGSLAGVAVDWRKRRAYFAENDDGTVRAVSLDLPGPIAMKQVPVLVQLPYAPLGRSLLGSLVLDADRDTLYVGLSIRAYSGPAVTSVWRFRSDGSGVEVARNLSQRLDGSWSVEPPVLALGYGSSTSARVLWVLTHSQSAQLRAYFDLTSFSLPLTPDSGNGTVYPLSAAIADPTGLVEDSRQGWLFVADRSRGITRLRTDGTDIRRQFIKLAPNEPLVAIGLALPAPDADDRSNDSSDPPRLLLAGAKSRLYAAPLQTPATVQNMTVLAEAQGDDSMMGYVIDPISCRMWYLNGKLRTRQANDWRLAEPQISQYPYATSNLASDSYNQLYFARNFPTTGEILRVDGNLRAGSGNMSVIVSSFGMQADGTTLATDPVGRKLYYVSDNLLFRSELDGSNPMIYVRTRYGTGVSSFVLDVKQRLLFFGEGYVPGCSIYQVDIDAPGTPEPVLIYSSPLTRAYSPATSLASDPVNRVLYALQCLRGGSYPSCQLYAITLGSSASGSTALLLATYYKRLPDRVQFDVQSETLFLTDPTGKTVFRCPVGPGFNGNLTCFDLHLNPHARLVAIAVDAPHQRPHQLYAIDEPSYTVVRFELLAEPNGPQPNLGSAFEVLHQLREDQLPNDYAPQLIQIDGETGLLYVRTSIGIGRGVMYHATPAPYSPLEPLINDSVVAFSLDPLRQQIHWIRSKKMSQNNYQNQLWSATTHGKGSRLVADWSNPDSSCGKGLPVALHLDPPSPANASIVPPAFWAVWSTSLVCHWNGTVMRKVASIPNYSQVKSTAYDPELQLLHVTGTYWPDVLTIFTVDLRKGTVIMRKQKDASEMHGIAVSPEGGDLFVANVLSAGWPSTRSVVFRFPTNTTFGSRDVVLRSVPPEMSLVDLQHPEYPIYFIDREGSSVWTARSNGSGQRLTHRAILAKYVNASAFWVDSGLGLFIWTERIRLDTRVAHLDLLDKVVTALLVPVADTITVMVDDRRGWLYWTDSQQMRLMRARLDGSDMECVWTSNTRGDGPLWLRQIEPSTGDLIAVNQQGSNVMVVQRFTLAGEVSTLLKLYVGSFSPLAGLGPVQLDPRHTANDTCQRLWLGASVQGDRQKQGFLGTACVGDTKVNRLVDLPS